MGELEDIYIYIYIYFIGVFYKTVVKEYLVAIHKTTTKNNSC